MVMEARSGVDLVFVPRFEKTLREGKDAFLERSFSRTEIGDSDVTQLASNFAVKEAVYKALGSQIGLKDIVVFRDKAGRPHVSKDRVALEGLVSLDVSISHDGDYIVGFCIAVFANE